MSLALIAAFIGGGALSFFLSGMETGVFALSRLRIRHLMRAGNPRARALLGYLEKPERFLWTILVGNTLANVMVSSIGVMWLYESLRGRPVLLVAALVLGVLVFYAVCELLPKMLFRHHPNRLCMALVAPFRMVDVALRPVVVLVTALSRLWLQWSGGQRFTGRLFGNRDELRQLMQDSAHGLTSEERTMINRVLDLQNLTVRDVTIPMASVAAVAESMPVAEVKTFSMTCGFSRLPVWKLEAGQRRISGVLSVWSVLYAEEKSGGVARDFVKPALYLDDGTRLEVALNQMQRTGQRLAIVLDRERRELGVISLQDVLKVIFGGVKA
jgi:putative hemolysin